MQALQSGVPYTNTDLFVCIRTFEGVFDHCALPYELPSFLFSIMFESVDHNYLILKGSGLEF